MTRDNTARILYLVKDQLPASRADLRAAEATRTYHRTTGVAVLLTILGGALGVITGFVGGLSVGVLMNHRLEEAFARNFSAEIDH